MRQPKNLKNMNPVSLVGLMIRFIGHCEANLSVGVELERQPVSFQSEVTIPRGVTRTQLQYPDSLTIDTYSASDHLMTVSTNPSPSASPLFVTAIDPSTSALSGTWVAMSNYSYTLDFEIEDPDDLIMDIGAPTWSTDVDEVMDDNVFLGKYHEERKGWVIDFERATFHRVQNRTGCIGMSNPAGEYLVIGRKIPSTNGAYNTFLPIDGGIFEVIGSPWSGNPNTVYPLQIGTWADGTRVMVRSQAAFTISMSLATIPDDFLPAGYQAAGTYVHIVRANSVTEEVELRLQLPAVRSRLVGSKIHPNQMKVCRRASQASSGPCQIVSPAVPAGTGALMTKAVIGVQGEYLLIAPRSDFKTQGQNGSEYHREGIECQNGNSTSVDGGKLCGLIEGESMSGNEVEGSDKPLKTSQLALLGSPGPVLPSTPLSNITVHHPHRRR